MRLTKAAIDMIKSFEGLYLKSYLDSVGVPTIGWGNTGPDIHLGMIWTEPECEARLKLELDQMIGRITPMIKVALSDNEFSALVSFSYNLGAGSLHGSTLLKLINSGDIDGAANEFVKWDHAGGKELAGLKRRRLAEAALFKS
jgi:lysozyme